MKTTLAKWLPGAFLVAISVTTPGCAWGGPGDPGDEDDAAQFQAEIAQALDEAEQAGASTEQLDGLRDAQRTGEITLEEGKQAALRTIACVEDAGGSGEYVEQLVALDYRRPGFLISADMKEHADVDAVLDGCSDRESTWLLSLYQGQPKFAEAQEALLDRRREARIACVQALGVDMPEDATWQEVTGAIYDSADARVNNCAAN